jgi:hypothetical protein
VLLRILGYKVVAPRVPNGWGRLTGRGYALALIKEAVATPYDVTLLLARKAISGVLRNIILGRK